MVEGHSGILAVSPPWFRPRYEPSKRRITWPNGAIATTYSGDEPDLLRGPQHDFAWADELASWRYVDAWDQLKFGLRLGEDPQAVITTTPRPTKIVKEIRDDPATLISVGTTFENEQNLAKTFIKTILKKYEGTRLGQQELYAKILDDNPLALWKRKAIEDLRVTKFPPLKRIVVAIDPAISDDPETAAEAGIVVAGVTAGTPTRPAEAYVLDDRSLLGSPGEWAQAAVTAYHSRSADRIVAEINQGGKMVEHTVRSVDKSVAYRAVSASRGKFTRAEPVAALYEQGLVHHVGCFPELEDEMCEWIPGEKSPNRMDALVWAITALMVDAKNKDGYGF